MNTVTALALAAAVSSVRVVAVPAPYNPPIVWVIQIDPKPAKPAKAFRVPGVKTWFCGVADLINQTTGKHSDAYVPCDPQPPVLFWLPQGTPFQFPRDKLWYCGIAISKTGEGRAVYVPCDPQPPAQFSPPQGTPFQRPRDKLWYCGIADITDPRTGEGRAAYVPCDPQPKSD